MTTRASLSLVPFLLSLLLVSPSGAPSLLLAEGEGGAPPGTTAQGGTAGATSSASVELVVPAPFSLFQSYSIQGEFAAAGTGMRNRGFGTIEISGIPADATVEGAFLYWVLLNPTAPPATGTFDSTPITGTLLGTGIDPCRTGLDGEETLVDSEASWTFRADVTALVPDPGNASYSLSGFPSGETSGSDPFLSSPNFLPFSEGASLVLVYSSPSEPQRDIVILDGNGPIPDGSENFTLTLALSGFQVSPLGTPSARLAFIGADGQTNFDDENSFNGSPLTALGTNPWDGSDGCCGYLNSDLWDTDIYDVSALVESGDTAATAEVESLGDCLVWTTAVLSVIATDTFPPVCESTTVGSGAAAVVNGSATETRPGDSGIDTVTLDPASTSIVLEVDEGFEPGDPSVSFTLSLAPGATGGSGSAIVTDLSGKTCRVGAEYTEVEQGAVVDERLFLDETQRVKFTVLDGNAPFTDVAVVDASPPGPDDVACLPECFEFAEQAFILTIDSPVEGFTLSAYDIEIGPDPNLRLLFRRPDDAVSCPYEDITEFIQDIGFDPRLGGSTRWSLVQFVAGRAIPGCVPATVSDADGDGFETGPGVPPALFDCDDANPNINPAAVDLCNGIDDDCDGVADDGNPGGGQVCIVTGQVGDCAQGVTLCVAGAIACQQVVTPAPETCDGLDNDCDTLIDEDFPSCGEPRGMGFYRRLCKKPHPEDVLTQADVDCVSGRSATFSGVASLEELCPVLTPEPRNDKCEQAEAQFMSLLLNSCKPRLYDDLSINSVCTGHGTVGESIADADTLLSNRARTRDDCVRAQCEAEEISSGSALGLNGLTLEHGPDGAVVLRWDEPPSNENYLLPSFYRVWRRPHGPGPFAVIGEAIGLSFLDPSGLDGQDYDYQVTGVRD